MNTIGRRWIGCSHAVCHATSTIAINHAKISCLRRALSWWNAPGIAVTLVMIPGYAVAAAGKDCRQIHMSFFSTSHSNRNSLLDRIHLQMQGHYLGSPRGAGKSIRKYQRRGLVPK